MEKRKTSANRKVMRTKKLFLMLCFLPPCNSIFAFAASPVDWTLAPSSTKIVIGVNMLRLRGSGVTPAFTAQLMKQ
jgi:hypothetical protein